MITDLIKFKIKEGCAEEAAALIRGAMQDDLGDEGCLLAKAFLSKTEANLIYVLLGWENRESIDKHLKTDHDRLFIKNLDPLLDGPHEFVAWEPL